MEKPIVISIDIGGTKISAATIDNKGKIYNFLKEKTDKRGGKFVILQLLKIIKLLLNKLNTYSEKIVGIGISIPGIVRNGIIVWAPNIPSWKNLPLSNILKQQLKLNIPIILVDDRSAAIMGEYWKGHAKNKKNAIFIIIGTGVGAGLLINGKPFSGSYGVAGSIGWMVINRNGKIRKPKKGLLEESIAGPAIAKKARNAILTNKKTILAKMCNNNLNLITSEMVFKAAKKRDPIARKIISEIVTYIGIAISNVISLLNPEIVLIGGGVGQELTNYLKRITKIVKIFAQPYASKKVKIKISKLKENTYLLGNAKIVFDKNIEYV